MPEPAPIAPAALRRAAELLEATGDALGRHHARTIRRYLAEAPEGLRLDQAAGLVPAPGQMPWWEEEAQQRRDAAIRAIRERYCPGMKLTHAAREIATMGRRFTASAGRPGRVPDGSKPLLAEVVGSGGFPGQRRIMDILRR